MSTLQEPYLVTSGQQGASSKSTLLLRNLDEYDEDILVDWAPPSTPTEASALIPPGQTGHNRRSTLPVYTPSETSDLGPVTRIRTFSSSSPASARPTDPTPRKSNDHNHTSNSNNINGVELALVNTGSVARDHLALERTYLAYVRTSLGIASAGVALMQFLRLGTDTKSFAAPIGAVVLFAGLLLLCFGTRRFFIVQRALVSGYFPPSILEIVFTSVALGSLVIGIFGVIIAGRIR